MSKVALITGILGQDGSYLADLLLEKGYGCKEFLILSRKPMAPLRNQVPYVLINR